MDGRQGRDSILANNKKPIHGAYERHTPRISRRNRPPTNKIRIITINLTRKSCDGSPLNVRNELYAVNTQS